jgi:DNA invertase Pin-like site-specific DNA recombinase
MADDGALSGTLPGVSGLLIGYARVSTDEQDLTARRNALTALGVARERIYVDHGLTGTHRDRPGLREALAACRGGDALVVTKLDRLARSVPDARSIADELTARAVKLISAARSTIRPTRSGGYCSTPWP